MRFSIKQKPDLASEREQRDQRMETLTLGEGLGSPGGRGEGTRRDEEGQGEEDSEDEDDILSGASAHPSSLKPLRLNP